MDEQARRESVEVLVEIPRGSRNKYEYDQRRRLFRLDRVLYAAVHYPTDYGFVVGTRAPGGDCLDALVVVEEPTFPGCLVLARPIGALEMRDERGADQKLLTVPVGDPRFAEVVDLADLASHWLREIEAFFATCKNLQGIETEVLGWHGAAEAWRLIAARRRTEATARRRRARTPRRPTDSGRT